MKNTMATVLTRMRSPKRDRNESEPNTFNSLGSDFPGVILTPEGWAVVWGSFGILVATVVPLLVAGTFPTMVGGLAAWTVLLVALAGSYKSFKFAHKCAVEITKAVQMIRPTVMKLQEYDKVQVVFTRVEGDTYEAELTVLE